MNADAESATNHHPRHHDSSQNPQDDPEDGAGLTGPVTTLQITVGVVGALSLLLAIIAGTATVVVTAFGVTALVPLALGTVIRAVGWRRRSVGQAERNEDAAIGLPVAALCWQPVVILSDLREQIVNTSATPSLQVSRPSRSPCTARDDSQNTTNVVHARPGVHQGPGRPLSSTTTPRRHRPLPRSGILVETEGDRPSARSHTSPLADLASPCSAITNAHRLRSRIGGRLSRQGWQ